MKCSAYVVNMFTNDLNQYYTGYQMHPRSSLSKTELRLANSTGIIDAGYRGYIIGKFDCKDNVVDVNRHDRIVQLCAPSLIPMYVCLVDDISHLSPQTERNEGGFGSTN